MCLPEAVKNFVWNTFRRTEKWWKKLYYNGLGEFMYRNGIVVSKEDLVTIECEDKACAPLHDTQSYDGCLVSVGGGKDSVVSLEVLKGEKITTYSINGNATTKMSLQSVTTNRETTLQNVFSTKRF